VHSVLADRRVTIAVIIGIALVFGIAGWRYFAGQSQTVSSARPPAPAQPAKAPAPAAKPSAAVAPAETSTALNQLEGTQQILVDDLQLLQGQVARQEAEIKRLKDELENLGQRFDALSAFASTAKANKPEPAVEPPKKKKKRVVRRSKKR
jgi:hypothetical protein